MKYLFIALVAIGIGFGAAKVVAMLNQAATPVAQNQLANLPASEMPIENPGATNSFSEQATETPEEPLKNKEINNEAIGVSFIGSSGNNTYEGSFSSVKANLKLIGGIIAGSVVVDTTSLVTPLPAATANWKSGSSFDVVKYPTASFVFTSWKKETGTTFTGTGKLTLRGITKTVTFPITYSSNQYSAQITLKAADFGFKNKLITDIGLTITVPVQ